MIAPAVLDPFEQEVTLSQERRVLSFSPRAAEVPQEDLVRLLAFDLVGAVPRPVGEVVEHFGVDGTATSYRSSFFQVGPAVLAVSTEISEPGAAHRVVELLGLGADQRVRLNLTRLRAASDDPALSPAAREAILRGRPLGQVRIWAGDPGGGAEVRRVLQRQLHLAGLEAAALDRGAVEPLYRPPAGERLSLDAFPADDLRVTGVLVELLGALPVEGTRAQPPRRVGVHDERLRRSQTIVSYHYETHRAHGGVLHLRRREVETGVERPGLVRTFNVAGLRGGARLRIRDVGGRATAEVAGAEESVALIRAELARSFGGRG